MEGVAHPRHGRAWRSRRRKNDALPPHLRTISDTGGARGRGRPEPVDNYGPEARATLAAVPDLLGRAEAVGAVLLARFLGQALTEA